MKWNPSAPFSQGPVTVFGRSRGGRELEEYRWGDLEKSIVFVSGFSRKDSGISNLLLHWKTQLYEAEGSGGILGEFDLRSLKKKCRIRIIPAINPDRCELYRTGITGKQGNPLNFKENQEEDRQDGKNLRGVDLNRNFSAKWIQTRRSSPERDDMGPFPESEPETAAFTRRMREDLPVFAVLLRYGENALYYPEEATPEELRQARFLGQYAGLTLAPAKDTGGTALQWFTHRGVKTIEARLPLDRGISASKLRDFLILCAALT